MSQTGAWNRCDEASSTPTHQDNLRLVQLLLHLHDRIRLPRVLISCDVLGHLRETAGRDDPFSLGRSIRRTRGDRVDPALISRLVDLEGEVVEELVQEGEGDADWVFGIGDEDTSDAFVSWAGVNVSCVCVFLY